MKLSAAIRIGSMTTKQIKGVQHDGGNGRCALGAAGDAAGLLARMSYFAPGFIYENLIERFPILGKPVKAPRANWTPTLGGVITYLNDIKGWSRERIADWVEVVERQEEAKEQALKAKEVKVEETVNA